jgi:D-hexose-6-phosphate mutarotase
MKSNCLAKNLRGGVPIATPVFDGAFESEIKALLSAWRINRKQVNNGCMMAVRVSALTVQ